MTADKTIELKESSRIPSVGAGLGVLAGSSVSLPLAGLARELYERQVTADAGHPPRLPRDRYDHLVDRLHGFFVKRNAGVSRLSRAGNAARGLLRYATLAAAPKSTAGLLAFMGGSALLGGLTGNALGYGAQGVVNSLKEEPSQIDKRASDSGVINFKNSNHTHTMTPFALLEKIAASTDCASVEKQAARGDQLLKSLKAIATSVAHGTGEARAMNAVRLHRSLDYPFRGSLTPQIALNDFVGKLQKGLPTFFGLNPRQLIPVSGRGTYKGFQGYFADDFPRAADSPRTSQFATELLDLLKNKAHNPVLPPARPV